MKVILESESDHLLHLIELAKGCGVQVTELTDAPIAETITPPQGESEAPAVQAAE